MQDDSEYNQMKHILYFKGMGQTKVFLVRVSVFPHICMCIHTHIHTEDLGG